MVADQEKDTPQIINIPWTDDLDQYLTISAGSDLKIIKRQVRDGIAQLWRCTSGERYLCYVVTRIELVGESERELCLVLGEGSGFGIFAPKFIEFAKRQKISFRTHVKRKGLIRMWAKQGLGVDEYILRLV